MKIMVFACKIDKIIDSLIYLFGRDFINWQ